MVCVCLLRLVYLFALLFVVLRLFVYVCSLFRLYISLVLFVCVCAFICLFVYLRVLNFACITLVIHATVLFLCITVCLFVYLFTYFCFFFVLNGVPARGRRRHEERGRGEGKGGALLGEGVAALANHGRLAAVGRRGVGRVGRVLVGRGWQGLGLFVRGLRRLRGDGESVLSAGRRGGRQREGRGGHAGPGGEEGDEGGVTRVEGMMWITFFFFFRMDLFR